MKAGRWKRIGRGAAKVVGLGIDIALIGDPVRQAVYRIVLNRLRLRRKLKRERKRVRRNDGSRDG